MIQLVREPVEPFGRLELSALKCAVYQGSITSTTLNEIE